MVRPWGGLTVTTKVDREATFLRLLVETEQGSDDDELTLRQIVQTVLGKDATGEYWRVARLFRPSGRGADRLRRFFEVTGSVSSTYPLPKVGFELAYRLRRAGAFRSVQPDVPSHTYDPTRSVWLDQDPSSRGIGDSEPDLPGTERKDWALKNIRCPQAWRLKPPAGGAARGAGVLVCVPDTGYTDHPELEPASLDLYRDYDVLNDDDDARDPLERSWLPWPDNPGHGTSTGAVVISRSQGSLLGVAPLARLVPVRAIKSVVVVFQGDVAKAIDHARLVGCHVISMSLGGLPFPGLQAAIQEAVNDGLIVLAAAGNFVPFVVWPAQYPECIAVAASNAEDRPWRGSSSGEAVFVAAPGESVWVPSFDLDAQPPVPRVVRGHGTSFATPHVAGVAALWLAHHGRDALIERYGRSHLQSAFLHLLGTRGHRRPPGWDAGQYGVGIVDAAALLEAPLPSRSEVRDAAAQTVPAPTDPVGQIHAVSPELTRQEVEERLGELFFDRENRLDEKLHQYGFELLYLMTERPEIREAFVREARPAGSVHEAGGGVALEVALRRAGSSSLVREVRPA